MRMVTHGDLMSLILHVTRDPVVVIPRLVHTKWSMLLLVESGDEAIVVSRLVHKVVHISNCFMVFGWNGGSCARVRVLVRVLA